MIKAALRLSSLCLLFALLIALAAPAYAATTSVPCDVPTLISDINGASSGDTLDLAAGCTYTLTSASSGSGLPTISITLTIHGNGATITRDTGAPAFGLIFVKSGGNLTLDNLTLSHGSSTLGGGIFNAGTMTVSNSTISGNSASDAGGGIENDFGTMTVSNSTISGNSAGEAGGIGNFSATLTVSNSTISGNSASEFNGGIENFGGAMTVTNSTFSNNSGTEFGGGIGNNDSGTMTVTNSTFSGNSASSGGGIYNFGGSTATLNNSIIANSTGGGDCGNAGTFNASHNLIEDSANACGMTNGINGNIVGSDPKLGALANNGGPTETFALLDVSPAIDVGSNALAVDASSNPLQYDQRGIAYARIFNSTVDMGSFEYGSTSPATHLVFLQQPNDTMIGTTITPAVTVAVEDAANTVVSSATDAITLAIDTNPGGGTLSGTLIVNASGGVATFGDLSINAAGTGYTLMASASGLTEATSALFNITTTPPASVSQQRAPISALCADLTSLANGAVTVSGGVQNVLLNGVYGNTYCHLIASGGTYLTSPAEIGVQSVISLGVVDAVDVFGQLPGGESVVPFLTPATICLRGSGDVLFLSAADASRTPQRLAATVSGGFECVSIPNSGTVVLVGSASNIPAAPTAAPSDPAPTTLANCKVTTTHSPLNLRSEANTSASVIAQLPYQLTLTATAHQSGWYQVIYGSGQGWVSDQFVSTAGTCG